MRCFWYTWVSWAGLSVVWLGLQAPTPQAHLSFSGLAIALFLLASVYTLEAMIVSCASSSGSRLQGSNSK